jgi:polyisoprenoid-binding protein YceI
MAITKVRGAFESYRGTVELDEADRARSRVSVDSRHKTTPRASSRAKSGAR